MLKKYFGFLIFICFPGMISANITFSKNGTAVFTFRNDGTVWNSSGFYGNMGGSIQSEEIGFRLNSTDRFWTAPVSSGRECRFSSVWNKNVSMPSTGLLFKYQSNTRQAVTNNGAFYSRDLLRITARYIKFNWNNVSTTNDALNLRMNASSSISVPEYSNGSSNYPAAYVKSTAVSIKASFSVEPTSVQSVRVIGLSDDNNGSLGSTIATNITFTNGVSSEYELLVSGNTPDRIWKSDDYWYWSIEEDGRYLLSQRTGPHKIYTILAAPQSPWNQTAGSVQNPWANALDFAINTSQCNMYGTTTISSAVSNASNYLFNSFGLTYDTYSGAPNYFSGSSFNLTAYMTKANTNVVNCYDQAASLVVFSSLVGGSSSYRFMNPFGYLPVTNLIGVGLCNNPFFSNKSPPLNVPLVGEDLLTRSRFGNHAFMKMSNTIFDACSGPHLGTESEQTYVNNAIDRSTTEEAAAAGTINSITTSPVTTIN